MGRERGGLGMQPLLDQRTLGTGAHERCPWAATTGVGAPRQGEEREAGARARGRSQCGAGSQTFSAEGGGDSLHLYIAIVESTSEVAAPRPCWGDWWLPCIAVHGVSNTNPENYKPAALSVSCIAAHRVREHPGTVAQHTGLV